MPDEAKGADLLVTMGGASVGDHDLVQHGAGAQRLRAGFLEDRHAAGQAADLRAAGRNAASGPARQSGIDAGLRHLFLRPAIAAMLGLTEISADVTAKLTRDLKANDGRQDYLRAKIEMRGGERFVEPFAVQDSSMLSVLAHADALVIRPPHAAAAGAGETVSVLLLE